MLGSLFLFALFIALLLTWGFTTLFGARGPGDRFLWFFLIVFLFAWAGGVWIAPVGPFWLGVSWVPVFVTGLLVALLLTAAGPRRPPRTRQEVRAQAAAEEDVAVAISMFFWILIILLAFSIIGRYLLWPRRPLIT
jgi:hypothetical protein